MKENVRLGRIAGVAVGFNWSLILIAALLALGLGSGRFPVEAPGYSRTGYAIAGVVTAVAFLGGVLAHEMSHALVARREGLKIDGVVLWLMGGYTRIAEEPKTPGAELRISGAGPVVSLFLGMVCGLLALAGEGVGISRLAVSVLAWLATINILLAGFNVLPGSPLDGGRMLHAAVWHTTGDRYRAARIAGRAGWLIGAALLGAGLLSMLKGLNEADGLWLAVVGWFLMGASQAETNSSELRGSLEGLKAADLMAQPGVAPGWLTVDAFLREYGGPGRPPAFLVEQWGGGLAGLVPSAALESVGPMYRGSVRAVDRAQAMASLPVFGPDAKASDVAMGMSDRHAAWALVVAWDRIIGVLSHAAIPVAARQARERQALDRAELGHPAAGRR